MRMAPERVWVVLAVAVYSALLGLPLFAQPGGAGIENPPTELTELTVDPGELTVVSGVLNLGGNPAVIDAASLSVTGPLFAESGIANSTGMFPLFLNDPDGVIVTGDLAVAEGLLVSGNFAVQGSVDAPLQVSNTLDVTEWIFNSDGPLVLADDVEITGSLDLQDATITDSTDGNVTVGDDLAVVGDLNVTGTITGGGFAPAYGGHVDSAATAEDVPSGWSASLATSTYTVTHSLDLSSATDLAISCTPVNVANHQCNIRTIGTDSFTVQIVQDDGENVSSAWFFTAVTVVN